MQVFTAEWESGRIARWRSLSWTEYKKFENQFRYDCPAQVYLDIYRAVLLYGPPIEGDPVLAAPAGLVNWIGKAMLDSNPFNGQYNTVHFALESKRKELQSDYLATAKAIVAGIFRYTFEEIDSWDAETFFERVAAAEFVSGRKIEPGDPNAKKRKRKKEAPVSNLPAPGPKFADPRMPAPVEETVVDNEGDAPRVSKRPLTPAQQMVIDRKLKQR